MHVKPHHTVAELRQLIRREKHAVLARRLQAVYNLLHDLGLEVLTPRPQHPDADPAAQESFKKKRPRSSPRSPRSIPEKKSTSGSKTKPASDRKGR